jgi:phosphoglycolate phosphatase-like HAD superfamily hydrolase
MEVLPGVADLLETLGRRPELGVGLLTGNIAGGAELKLRSAGLHEHFVLGSYGSDHEERDELPAIALRRAAETWGVTFDPESVFVVGDTPRDVQCGQKENLRTLAVATGHFGVEALLETGADHVVRDLRDTAGVMTFLTS